MSIPLRRPGDVRGCYARCEQTRDGVSWRLLWDRHFAGAQLPQLAALSRYAPKPEVFERQLIDAGLRSAAERQSECESHSRLQQDDIPREELSVRIARLNPLAGNQVWIMVPRLHR